MKIMKLSHQVPPNNAGLSFRALAIVLIPPIVAATICGWLIGYWVFSFAALAGITSAAALGTIGVYYLQLRMMFQCEGTWFGDKDASKAPSETITRQDEEKAFIKMIEEES